MIINNLNNNRKIRLTMRYYDTGVIGAQNFTFPTFLGNDDRPTNRDHATDHPTDGHEGS